MKHTPRTIMVLVIVGGLVTVQALLGNIVANQLQERLGPWSGYVLPAFLLITVGLISFTVRNQITNVPTESHRVTIDQRQAEHNRRAMLEKVRLIWIEGFLSSSLYQETMIPLSIKPQPFSVTLPLGRIIQRSHNDEQPLPSTKRILHVFDEFGKALLILGAPGAGKTTILLELARDLIQRAQDNPISPIPVIFTLSTWANTRRPLEEWLADELNKRYDVAHKIAHAWIANDAILPMLDGLDEVPQPHRVACIEAINAYHKAHSLLPLVVSSRIADYDTLKVKLRLHGAIVVQPLTREQVKGYLRQIGIHVTPSSASPWWDLLDTPLMLNIAALTYSDQGGQLLLTGTSEEQRDQLFTAYVTRMFERRPSNHFSQDHSLKWLKWLAWQMEHRNQTIFHLEHLQPEWLPTCWARWQYAIMDRVGSGMVVGVCVSLIYGQMFGQMFGFLYGLTSGLLTGLFGGMIQPSSTQQGVAQRIWSMLLGGLIVGLIYGVLSAFISGLAVGVVNGVVYGVFNGIAIGLFGTLASALVGGPSIRPRHIITVEALHWSWSQAWRSMLTGLFLGVLGGLAYGLVLVLLFEVILGLIGGLGSSFRFGLSYGVKFGLSYGVVFGLSYGVIFGLTSSSVDQKVHPNQATRRSGRNALLIGLVGALIGVLGDGLVMGLIFGLEYGILLGLVFGLAKGGYAYLSHTVLRLVLWHKDVLPLAYVRFLDENAQRILLRKVGGGYSFIHRLMLEYFAKQYERPESNK